MTSSSYKCSSILRIRFWIHENIWAKQVLNCSLHTLEICTYIMCTLNLHLILTILKTFDLLLETLNITEWGPSTTRTTSFTIILLWSESKATAYLESFLPCMACCFTRTTCTHRKIKIRMNHEPNMLIN